MSLRLYPGTPVPGRLVRSNDRFFYGGMALLIATIVFVGFARTYYLATYFNAPPLNPLRIVHGALFSSWILLFMVQTTLIATNRRELHRRLGVAGAMLAIAMVVVGVSLAIETARDGRAPLGLEPRVFLIIPMFDMLVFAPLVAAGVYFRRVAETHKRLMLLATISLLAAALARFTTALAAAGPLFFFGAVDLWSWPVPFMISPRAVACIPPIWGGLLIVVSQPLRLLLSGTDAWLGLADFLVGR